MIATIRRFRESGGTILLRCDFREVPAVIKRLIEGKRYMKVSAEIYDDAASAGVAGGRGKMLRRVAILGGELPQLKNLADIPIPTDAGEMFGVEIFSEGVHRDKRYSAQDLADIIRNFENFSRGPRPVLRVPLVVGHGEDQGFLDRSDLPAAGYATRLWREGVAAHSERSTWFTRVIDIQPARRVAGLFSCYSELCFSERGTTMNRNDLLAKLAELGYDTSLFADCPDAALAEILRVQDARAEEQNRKDPEGQQIEAYSERHGERYGVNKEKHLAGFNAAKKALRKPNMTAAEYLGTGSR